MSKKTAQVWDKPAPNKDKHTKLTPSSKRKAKASAKKAGRSGPSLVDNINAAKAQKKKAAGPKSSQAKKSSPAKNPSEDKGSSKKKTTSKAKAASK